VRAPVDGSGECPTSVVSRDGDRHEIEWDREAFPYLATVQPDEDGGAVVSVLSRDQRRQLILDLSPDGTVFKWAVSRRHAFATVKQVFKEIGLSGGRTQWLRRSGATHAEMVRRGAAREYLCHATQGLAERNYIDFTQLIPELPMPPGIE
jgi:hypothetical protein